MIHPLLKLPLIGLMAKSLVANPSKCRSLHAERSSHREAVVAAAEGVEEVEEVSEGVAVEDPTLTLKEETGPAPTVLAAT